jgi:hypothetical protein
VVQSRGNLIGCSLLDAVRCESAHGLREADRPYVAKVKGCTLRHRRRNITFVSLVRSLCAAPMEIDAEVLMDGGLCSIRACRCLSQQRSSVKVGVGDRQPTVAQGSHRKAIS